MKRTVLFVSSALAIGPLVGLFACGGDPNPDPNTALASTATAPTTSDTPTVTDSATATDTTPPTPPKPPPPTIEDFPPSADPKPLPTVKITAPGNESAFADEAKAKASTVKLDIKNWELGKDMQHVHVILDNCPYMKVMDPKKEIKLGELETLCGADLTEGQHFLVAFPSRGTHESVKGKGASAFVTFWVGKKGKPAYDGKGPVLIYSRPKGANAGDMGKSLLVDFYLHNTNLDKGEKVRYTISAPNADSPLTGTFDSWAPKLVKGLVKGDVEVKLELLDKDGNVSALPWNTITRKVTVDPDAPNDPMMGMAMDMPMGSASATPPPPPPPPPGPVPIK